MKARAIISVKPEFGVQVVKLPIPFNEVYEGDKRYNYNKGADIEVSGEYTGTGFTKMKVAVLSVVPSDHRFLANMTINGKTAKISFRK